MNSSKLVTISKPLPFILKPSSRIPKTPLFIGQFLFLNNLSLERKFVASSKCFAQFLSVDLLVTVQLQGMRLEFHIGLMGIDVGFI